MDANFGIGDIGDSATMSFLGSSYSKSYAVQKKIEPKKNIIDVNTKKNDETALKQTSTQISTNPESDGYSEEETKVIVHKELEYQKPSMIIVTDDSSQSESDISNESYQEEHVSVSSSKYSSSSMSSKSSVASKSSKLSNQINLAKPSCRLQSSEKKDLPDYPPITADIRNHLVRCHTELSDLISDLCDENKHLNAMYEEIKKSPIAVELKAEYEKTIEDLKEKFADLQKLYRSSSEENEHLRADILHLQQENDDMNDDIGKMASLEKDLKSAVIRRDLLERELKETQDDMDTLRQDKRCSETQVDDQRKQIRNLTIEVNTLRAELESRDTRRSDVREERREERNQERKEEKIERPAIPEREDVNAVNSVVPYGRNITSKRESSNVAIALFDYDGNKDFNSAPMKKGTKMVVTKYSDAHDWALVRFNNVVTWEPASFIEVVGKEPQQKSRFNRPSSVHIAASPTAAVIRKAKVLADFEAVDKSEMSVRFGEIIQVSSEDDQWVKAAVGARVFR